LFFSKELLQEAGAHSCGSVPFAALEESMTDAMRKKAARVCPWAKMVYSFVFPYGNGGEGNLAAYARGRDYHLVIKERLDVLRRKLEEELPGSNFAVFADDAPFPEVLAASFSGAGVLGKNGLIFCPPYGCRVLLGEIVTDAYKEHPAVRKSGACLNCSRCLLACPTGAMTQKDGRRILDTGKCISAITQKKGDLNPEEIEYLRKSPYIWGCDECVKACPLSGTGIAPDYVHEEGLIFSLRPEDISGLSDKEFLSKYPERSFTWRGVKPLLRNLAFKKGIKLNNNTPKQE